ncbi:MAG: NUDIX hydrolase [Candidatus Verstraetearchaeota archaeon]|nr:NUDIX hydrolase [Candidatus Verstraetearchaeota archaeon]
MPKDLERTISSHYPFSGRLIKVRVDEVVLPSGRRTTRELVEHRGAVAIVAVEDGKVLLERQYRHTAGRAMLEIPAGTLDAGEDPLRCAHRELREETGYTADKMEEVIHFYNAVGYSTEVIRIFLATGLKRAKARPEEDESIETHMIPFEKALKMVGTNEIEDAKTIIGLFAVRNRIKGY